MTTSEEIIKEYKDILSQTKELDYIILPDEMIEDCNPLTDFFEKAFEQLQEKYPDVNMDEYIEDFLPLQDAFEISVKFNYIDKSHH